MAVGQAGSAAAESPSRVAEQVADDGVFIGFGRSAGFDEQALANAVAAAAIDDLTIVVVAPVDPQPTTRAFARRIQELTEVDVAIVFPPEGPMEAYASDVWSTTRPRALEEARQLNVPSQAVDVFVEELLSDGGRGRPPIVGQIIRALVLFVLAIAAVLGIEAALARAKSSRTPPGPPAGPPAGPLDGRPATALTAYATPATVPDAPPRV